MRVRSRPAVRLAGLSVAYGALVAACNPNKVTAPPPPVETPVQVRFSAIGAPATACLPTVSISLAGPVGTRLTWVGMGVHVAWSPPYDENFDLAFTRRYWAGEGLTAGESTSSHSMQFAGPGPIEIRMRFTYTVTADAITHTDSVAVECT